MSHIYIYSPAGAVRDKAAFKRAVQRLKAQGHEVQIDEAALASHQRFAGDDDTRLAAIGRAAASGADLAMITRGGYGLTRLLPRLPYKALAKAVKRGTHFVGLSDFTALQCAMLAQAQAPSWAGPALLEDFGREDEPDEIMQACFDDLTSGQGEGSGWRLPKDEAGDALIRGASLWGGNLSILAALVGTPYLPAISGGILFIEDVNEHPYRVERMLTQLLHAGVLARQKAIVFGQFSNYRLVPHDKGFKLASVVTWLRTQVKARVLTGLPFGHVPTKVLLPFGQPCDLLVQEREALLLWGQDL
ncbi:MAG: LD-carboxypeptidase [Betaproteobacteria bacterium]